MSIENPPYALENATTHTAQLFRLAASSAITAGVIGNGDLLTSANGTPNMSVNVAAGSAWVGGTLNAPQQSKYFVLNEATVNLAIAASDPTHARFDVVCLTIQDSQYAGSPIRRSSRSSPGRQPHPVSPRPFRPTRSPWRRSPLPPPLHPSSQRTLPTSVSWQRARSSGAATPAPAWI